MVAHHAKISTMDIIFSEGIQNFSSNAGVHLLYLHIVIAADELNFVPGCRVWWGSVSLSVVIIIV